MKKEQMNTKRKECIIKLLFMTVLKLNSLKTKINLEITVIKN